MGEKPHKRLEAWRKSLDLAVSVYEATATFPPDERFGIVAQIRRAAVSISSNIAEGAARGSKKFFSSALHIARASLSELDTQIAVSTRLGYLDDSTCLSRMRKNSLFPSSQSVLIEYDAPRAMNPAKEAQHARD